MARLGAFNLDSVQKAQTGKMKRLLMASPSSSIGGQTSTSKAFLSDMFKDQKKGKKNAF